MRSASRRSGRGALLTVSFYFLYPDAFTSGAFICKLTNQSPDSQLPSFSALMCWVIIPQVQSPNTRKLFFPVETTIEDLAQIFPTPSAFWQTLVLLYVAPIPRGMPCLLFLGHYEYKTSSIMIVTLCLCVFPFLIKINLQYPKNWGTVRLEYTSPWCLAIGGLVASLEWRSQLLSRWLSPHDTGWPPRFW